MPGLLVHCQPILGDLPVEILIPALPWRWGGLTVNRASALVLLAFVAAAGQTHAQPAKKNFWTLGFYRGASPLDLQPISSSANPILKGLDVTDMNVDALAHPFMVIRDGRYYVFFTAKDLKSDQGGIGLVESGDGLKWKFRRTVIREPFVQSHPFVFEWRNEYYLIPEAHTETAVRLYKAISGRMEIPGQPARRGNFHQPDAGPLSRPLVAVHGAQGQ